MRYKIFISGYEHWIDPEKQVIYGSEKANHGLPIDIVRGSDNMVVQIFSPSLADNEKRQMKDALNSAKI